MPCTDRQVRARRSRARQFLARRFLARRGWARRGWASAAGMLAGVAIDQIAGDPRRGHPVALFGAAAGRLEARLWRDDRAAGAGYAALLVAAPAALGLLSRRLPASWRAAATALAT